MKYLKSKTFIINAIIVLLLLSSGCGFNNSVEYISNWSFQFNESSNDYSLFIGFEDSKNNQMSTEANVDIRIVNDANETVYQDTVNVSEENFGYYTSKMQGENFLADIRIPYSKIKKGKSPDGKVYFTVYSEENQFGFDECNCEAIYCLPIANFDIKANDLPKEIVVKDYDGSIASKISIQDIKVNISDDLTPLITVTVMGEKTFENKSYVFDSFGYQLIDEEGYAVESGTIMLNQLKKGDKFKDDSIMLFDLIPGENYTLEFCETVY